MTLRARGMRLTLRARGQAMSSLKQGIPTCSGCKISCAVPETLPMRHRHIIEGGRGRGPHSSPRSEACRQPSSFRQCAQQLRAQTPPGVWRYRDHFWRAWINANLFRENGPDKSKRIVVFVTLVRCL